MYAMLREHATAVTVGQPTRAPVFNIQKYGIGGSRVLMRAKKTDRPAGWRFARDEGACKNVVVSFGTAVREINLNFNSAA